MEHVGSKQGRAGPARCRGLGMHSQAHRAPAMWAHDSGGERLTAAWSHRMPRLWGAPELKDKQAEGKAGGGRSGMEREAPPWHRWTNKREQQNRPGHSVVKSSVRRVSRRPPEYRGTRLGLGGHTSTRGSRARCRANGPQAQPGGDLVYQSSSK